MATVTEKEAELGELHEQLAAFERLREQLELSSYQVGR